MDRNLIVGDWMGSIYSVGGKRFDEALFLDHDGSFQRNERSEANFEHADSGRWDYDETQFVLTLHSNNPKQSESSAESRFVVRSVSGVDSNLLLVLHPLVLGSRILPIIYYRVHCNDRAYGTGWLDRLQTNAKEASLENSPPP